MAPLQVQGKMPYEYPKNCNVVGKRNIGNFWQQLHLEMNDKNTFRIN